MSLDRTKRMSKKVDADRAWADYYRNRPTRGMKGQPHHSVVTLPDGCEYHYTKGFRK